MNTPHDPIELLSAAKPHDPYLEPGVDARADALLDDILSSVSARGSRSS